MATLSDDDALRYDALAIVRKFKIPSALPALDELAERLRGATAPGAPYELLDVHRVMTSLTAADES